MIYHERNRVIDYEMNGPALFRGRLRALGKCSYNGVAFSKGRPKLASVRLTL